MTGSATLEQTSALTFEQYDAMPEIAGRYEIVQGELIMTAAPYPRHQWYQENIMERLRPFVRSRKLGVALNAPVDVVISVDPLQVRQPDLLFVSKERSGWTQVSDFADVPRLQVAPELVVEILSTSDRRRAVEAKLNDYRSIGVTEAWLVDVDAQVVTVLRLSDDQTLGVFSGQDAIRSVVLPEFAMTVEQVFA